MCFSSLITLWRCHIPLWCCFCTRRYCSATFSGAASERAENAVAHSTFLQAPEIVQALLGNPHLVIGVWGPYEVLYDDHEEEFKLPALLIWDCISLSLSSLKPQSAPWSDIEVKIVVPAPSSVLDNLSPKRRAKRKIGYVRCDWSIYLANAS